MISFILGKSKTGKTTHIYKEIEQNIKDNMNVILFVPSQCRAKAEKEYMKILNRDGVMGVNITTISEYVKEQLKIRNLHIEEKYMSKLDRKIILTQVIKENPKLFNVFNKVKNYSGFLDELDIYMDLFRKNNIDSKEYININLPDKRTDSKFKEILSVYDKYIDKIKTNYVDSVDEMDMFLKNIDLYKDISSSNTIIYFDGYNNFTNSEYKFIDVLIAKQIDITITLNTDITKIEDIYISSSIFETSNKTYKKICKIANKNNAEVNNVVKYDNLLKTKDDLKFIANNIFAQDTVKKKLKLENAEIVVHTNVLNEIESVAKIISKKIKEGCRYSDFVIYTTNIDEYDKVISRIFYENNLEIYISKSRSLTQSILTKYIQGLINIATKGLNLELIFDLLKLGLTDIDLKDIYLLENYLREFNVNKYFINNKFTLNNQSNSYDLDHLNSLKNKIIEMYSFVNTINNTSCKDIINKLYNHLYENNIFNNFSELITSQKQDAVDLDINNFEDQVWDNLSDIFNSIIKVYGDDEITISEFGNIFNLVIKDSKIKTLPPTKDQIELADINVSKIEAKKYMFFIGVVEGKFPKKVDEDIFFTDNEIESLKEKNIDIKETTISKLNMGFFNIYEALNNVLEKLYIYIPSASLDGKATRKSSFITLLEQICDFDIIGQVTKVSSNNDIYDNTSKDELFMWLIKNIRELDEDDLSQKQDLIEVYEYFKKDKKYNQILEYKKDDSKLDKKIVDIIYSNEFKTSVSKLEMFKKCPFSYFMQYVLKVYPNNEAKLNVLELGSFMHSVLEQFSKVLLLKNVKWQDILTEDKESIKVEYEKILEDIIEELIDRILSKQKQSVKYMVLKRKLINTMKKVIATVALSYYQSDFEPYGYEIEFKDNSVFLPMQIQLDNNKIMKIIGKIDRVDMLNYKDTMYVRVVDYKSSSKDLKIDKIKEGISLQLISYLIAFMENKKDIKIKPAGIVYFNLSDKLVALSQYENDNENIKKAIKKKLKMNGIFLKDIEILNKMDKYFEDNQTMSLIDITKRTINSSSKKALEYNEFENLCDETKDILRQIGDDISCGVVKIAPNKKEDYCKYCNYSSTCRKNIEV